MREKVAALILASGKSKRLGILCSLRPKPALPFAGRFRVIDFTLSNCVHSRISNIAVLVDYQRNDMTRYLKRWYLANGEAGHLSVLHPKMGSYAGTADAVYQNLYYVVESGFDRFLILAGGHVYKMDYRNLLALHEKVDADATIGVVRVPIEQSHHFGMVHTDDEGRIKEFAEKSSQPESSLASMGIYVFNKEILTRCLLENASEPNPQRDFSYDILPKIVKQNRVFAYEFSGYWQEIGNLETYYGANMGLLGKQPNFSLDGSWSIFTDSNALATKSVSQQKNIENSLISPGCMIKGFVENSILSQGVTVEEDAIVRNSVVMANCYIGFHSVIDRCILDEKVNIGKFCYIGFRDNLSLDNEGITVLGKSVIVPSYTAIGRKCKVLPRVGTDAFVTNLVPSGSVLSNPDRHTKISKNIRIKNDLAMEKT